MIQLGIPAALPILLGFLTFALPESPVWDVQQGNVDAARRTLLQLRQGEVEVVAAEISMHQVVILENEARVSQAHFWEILNRDNLKRTLTAGALLSLSQVGGQVLVLTYATVVLAQSGVGNAFEITIIISCAAFLGTLIGPFLLGRCGRRPVALAGFSILFMLNLAIGGLGTSYLARNAERLAPSALFIIFRFLTPRRFNPCESN